MRTDEVYSLHELLVLSFFNESRILRLAPSSDEDSTEADIEEIDLPSFSNTSTTLLACNLGGLLVQVTPTGINYFDPDGDGMSTGHKWTAEGGKKITLAASDGEHLVLALAGGEIVLIGQGANGEIVQTG